MKKIQFADSDLAEAIKKSPSYADACRALGFNYQGGMYRRIRDRAIALNLDIGHFNPYKRKNSGAWNKLPLAMILRDNVSYNSGRLKKRLIHAGKFEDICSECGIGPQWNGKPLTLQLDHKNGRNDDNRIDNLRILCPNCHTQTLNYCSKNKRK